VLSDAEQRRLTAIESKLRTDDPVFVRQFNSGWKRRRPGRLRGLAASVAVTVAVAAALIGLLLGSVAMVVCALTAIGATAGLWITSRGRPPVLASAGLIFAALAVVIAVVYGIQAAMILVVVAVLVARFVARRYVYARLKDQYQRHGDRMD
jgi:Protein of unknown function (DUF3040)